MLKTDDKIIPFSVREVVEDTFNTLSINRRTNKQFIPRSNHLLLFCSELLGSKISIIKKFQPEIEDLIVQILTSFEKLSLWENIGMFTGMGNLAFSIKSIQNKTGQLTRLSSSLDQLLLDQTLSYVKTHKNIYEPCNYDLISGVSGILYYFLNNQNSIVSTSSIQELVDYLNFILAGYELPNLKSQNISFKILEKDNYCDISLLLDMAHGILSCLISLSKANYLGYKLKKGLDVISNMLDIYSFFYEQEPNCLIFPIETSHLGTTHGKSIGIKKTFNSGWCCGSSGICYGLLKSFSYLSDRTATEFYRGKLVDILNQDINNHNFEYPILCHGYSSLLCLKDFYIQHGLQNSLSNVVSATTKSHIELLTKGNQNDRVQYLESNSILTGNLGVTLSLLSLWSSEFEFAKLLMLD